MADSDNDGEAAKKEEKEKQRQDCIKACDDAYRKCMDNAGSDMEKAVCKAAYTKCIANC